MPNQWTEPSQTKTQAVLETLEKLGFAVENPPADWKKKTDDALLRKNISVHSTVIYQARRQLIEGKEKGRKMTYSPPPRPQVASAPVVQVQSVQQTANPNPNPTSLSLAQIIKVAEVAKEFGGIDRVIEVATALKAIRSLD